MQIRDLQKQIGTGAAALPDRQWPSDTVERLAKGIVNDAIEALWAFFNRPLANGARWAVVEGPEGLSSFAQGIGTRPEHLIAMCRDLCNHDGLTTREANALRAVVEIADALGFSKSDPGATSFHRFVGDEIASRRQCDGSSQGKGVVKNAESRRSEDRAAIVLATDFHCEAKQYRVRVRNLSSHGAMIDGVKALPSGGEAAVHIENVGWVNGTIAWSLEFRCGMAFDRPLDLEGAGLVSRPTSGEGG